MRLRPVHAVPAAPLLAALAIGVTSAAGQAPAPTPPAPAAAPSAPVNANEQLSCVRPDDAAGIDAVLARAGSPLAGDGETFVTEATAAGIDPRFVVAVAAHETMLMTYGPAQTINNPFGLGPGMRFADHKDAVRFAARLLGRHYVGEGRSTIPLIGSKWAPVGAANDPGGLNSHWTSGVSRYYAMLGGNPHAPVTLARQRMVTCDATAPAPAGSTAPAGAPATAAPPRAGDGPLQVVLWNGTPPPVAGASAAHGTDPASGAAATIDGFAFPLAVPANGEVRYTTDACDDGTSCATPLESAPMATVVAATAGTLAGAGADEQRAGVGFWIVTPSGDRIGYGPLAAYAPGIQAGTPVVAGQALGNSTGALSITWRRGEHTINPRPLLAATRPPSPAG